MISRVFFMRKYDLDASTANSVSSVVYLISAIASPILGNLVDRTGRNVTWVFMAVLVTLGCHAMLTFTFWKPFIPMVNIVSCIMEIHRVSKQLKSLRLRHLLKVLPKDTVLIHSFSFQWPYVVHRNTAATCTWSAWPHHYVYSLLCLPHTIL